MDVTLIFVSRIWPSPTFERKEVSFQYMFQSLPSPMVGQKPYLEGCLTLQVKSMLEDGTV